MFYRKKRNKNNDAGEVLRGFYDCLLCVCVFFNKFFEDTHTLDCLLSTNITKSQT